MADRPEGMKSSGSRRNGNFRKLKFSQRNPAKTSKLQLKRILANCHARASTAVLLGHEHRLAFKRN
jgi:hypothetical protein